MPVSSRCALKSEIGVRLVSEYLVAHKVHSRRTLLEGCALRSQFGRSLCSRKRVAGVSFHALKS